MTVENKFSSVRKILFAQFLITILVAIAFVSLGGWQYAISPLIGSGIALIPNIFFAYKIYIARNSSPHDMVNAFYVGEAIKLLLTIALFAIVLKFYIVDFLTLLAGYASVLSVFWFALYYWRN